MDIGWAVEQLKAGHRVRRPAWNGKGMWLCLSPAYTVPSGAVPIGLPALALPNVGHLKASLDVGGHVIMRTAAGGLQPGWVCSQADLLATDWELADGAADAPPQG